MIIPHTELSPEALQGLIEEIVTRDGTDYGEYELSTQEKVQQVINQLERKEVVIVFSELHETCTLMPADTFKQSDEENG